MKEYKSDRKLPPELCNQLAKVIAGKPITKERGDLDILWERTDKDNKDLDERNPA